MKSDRWVDWRPRTQTDKDVVVVRYADDFIIGFEVGADAQWLLNELRERLRKFGLELHGDKTRMRLCRKFGSVRGGGS